MYDKLCVVFQPDWCFNLGEQAIDVAIVSYQTAPPSILVLGNTINHTLYTRVLFY